MTKKIIKIVNLFILTWVFINLLFAPVAAYSFSNGFFVKDSVNENEDGSIGMFGRMSPINKVNRPAYSLSYENSGSFSRNPLFVLYASVVLVLLIFLMFISRLGKKGILFTLGLTLLVLVVMSLAMLIYHFNQAADDRTVEVGSLDRLQNMDSSISRSLSKIFDKEAGITIDFDNNGSLIFEEYLPNSNNDTFISSINLFKSFVESSDNFTTLNVTELVTTLPLIVYPDNMRYSHDSFGNRTLNFSYGNATITEYNLTISTGIINVSSLSPCSLNTGSLAFNLFAYDSQGNNFTCENNVNPSSAYNFSVGTSDGPIDIDYTGLGVIIENKALTLRVLVRLSIDFSQDVIDRINIGFDSNITHIEFSEYHIVKDTKPVIIW